MKLHFVKHCYIQTLHFIQEIVQFCRNKEQQLECHVSFLEDSALGAEVRMREKLQSTLQRALYLGTSLCSVPMKYAFYPSEFSTNCLENGEEFGHESFSFMRIKEFGFGF